MKMYVNVVRTPFYAVTGAWAKCEIKRLAAGDYTLAFVQKVGERPESHAGHKDAKR
jgi:hypothetical protein